jgi:hypothetical protein
VNTSIWSRWVWPIVSGRTRQAALPVALVVGTLLLAVNQGSDLSSGDLDLGTALRGLANYLIPYVVSSIGYLKGTNGPGRSEVEEAAL